MTETARHACLLAAALAACVGTQPSRAEEARKAATGDLVLAFDLGGTLMDDADDSLTGSRRTVSHDTGARVGASVGLHVFNGARVELQSVWLSADAESVSTPTGALAAPGGSRSFIGGLLGATYEIPDLGAVTPSIGVAAGYGQFAVDVSGAGRSIVNDEVLAPAFQAAIGFGYDIGYGVRLGLDYRYLYVPEQEFTTAGGRYEAGLAAHSLSLGVSYRFGGVVALPWGRSADTPVMSGLPTPSEGRLRQDSGLIAEARGKSGSDIFGRVPTGGASGYGEELRGDRYALAGAPSSLPAATATDTAGLSPGSSAAIAEYQRLLAERSTLRQRIAALEARLRPATAPLTSSAAALFAEGISPGRLPRDDQGAPIIPPEAPTAAAPPQASELGLVTRMNGAREPGAGPPLPTSLPPVGVDAASVAAEMAAIDREMRRIAAAMNRLGISDTEAAPTVTGRRAPVAPTARTEARSGPGSAFGGSLMGDDRPLPNGGLTAEELATMPRLAALERDVRALQRAGTAPARPEASSGALLVPGSDTAPRPSAFDAPLPAAPARAAPLPTAGTPALPTILGADDEGPAVVGAAGGVDGSGGFVAGIGVQVASFLSEDKARAAWETLRQSHDEVLGGQSPKVVRVSLGARGTVWRLYAAGRGEGMPPGEADQLCRALRARGADCLVAPIGG